MKGVITYQVTYSIRVLAKKGRENSGTDAIAHTFLITSGFVIILIKVVPLEGGTDGEFYHINEQCSKPFVFYLFAFIRPD